MTARTSARSSSTSAKSNTRPAKSNARTAKSNALAATPQARAANSKTHPTSSDTRTAKSNTHAAKSNPRPTSSNTRRAKSTARTAAAPKTRSTRSLVSPSAPTMSPLLAPIAKAFARDSSVVAKTMFASVALTVRGKIFAMVDSRDRFVVKLPAARVASLIGSGASAWPGGGKVMKQWVALPAGESSSWIALAKEARDFVLAS